MNKLLLAGLIKLIGLYLPTSALLFFLCYLGGSYLIDHNLGQWYWVLPVIVVTSLLILYHVLLGSTVNEIKNLHLNNRDKKKCKSGRMRAHEVKLLFDKIFSSQAKLSDMERRVLDAVKVRLGKNVAALWEQQIAGINKVQRLPRGVEVNFYRMARGKPTFDNALAFPNKSTELLVARVVIAANGSPPILSAQIWSVRGFVFSIEYGGDAVYLEGAMAMNPPPEISIECELVADLNQTESPPGSAVETVEV